MKKLLVNSKEQWYSFDDVLEMYDNTIRHEAYQFVQYNKQLGYSQEDIEQELRMILYNCFNQYENKGNHFSTYYHSSIRHFKILILRKYSTQKREGFRFEDSLNRKLGKDDDTTMLDFQESITDTESEFMYKHIIETMIAAAETEIEKDIIKYFLEIENAADLAKKHNLSRQGMHNNINRFREKLRKLLL